MSPRPGGEAAKFGDRFEGRWTVRYLLDVLFGRAEAVVVEDVDDAAESVEFYATVNGGEQGHQVKRQWRANVTWPVSLPGELLVHERPAILGAFERLPAAESGVLEDDPGAAAVGLEAVADAGVDRGGGPRVEGLSVAPLSSH